MILLLVFSFDVCGRSTTSPVDTVDLNQLEAGDAETPTPREIRIPDGVSRREDGRL